MNNDKRFKLRIHADIIDRPSFKNLQSQCEHAITIEAILNVGNNDSDCYFHGPTTHLEEWLALSFDVFNFEIGASIADDLRVDWVQVIFE